MPIKYLIYSYNVPTTAIAAKCGNLLRPALLLTANYSITGSESPINSSKSPIRRSYSLTNFIITSLRRIALFFNYSGGIG